MSATPVVRRGDGDRGAALIEFSVVIGVLLYIILGAVSFGILLARVHQLNEAAGESARTAALAWDDPLTAEDDRIATAQASLENSGVDCSADSAVDCSVTVQPCAAQPTSSCATVSLTHDRAKDPLVGRIPVLEYVLPDELHAEATAMVDP